MSTRVYDIPPMTDPLGRYWEQPDRSRILVDGRHALMSSADFRALHDYTRSEPTGLYVGKMWRAKYADGWALCYVTECNPPEAGYVAIRRRGILLIDGEEGQ